MSDNRRDDRMIPLFDLKLDEATIAEVNACLESGWLTSGPRVQQFESKVAEYLQMEHVAAVNSATIAIQIVLSAIGASPGREVVTSPFTFTGTISAIMHTGARPVLVDIEEDTLNIDAKRIEGAISERTIAVLPVDIAGLPCDYQALSALCEERQIPLISDSAHAIGARYRGRSIPHYTDASIFSLYSTKNLTCGEGGLVVSKHEALIDTVRLLRQHGLTKSTSERNEIGQYKYDVKHLGFKANLSDLHAAVGLGQLRMLEKNQAERTRLAGRYQAAFADFAEFLHTPESAANSEHGWHLYIIRLKLGRLKISRDQFIDLMVERNIQCGLHYQPVFELSFFQKALNLNRSDYPHAAAAGEAAVSLPLYPGLSDYDQDRVIESALEILIKNKR